MHTVNFMKDISLPLKDIWLLVCTESIYRNITQIFFMPRFLKGGTTLSAQAVGQKAPSFIICHCVN